MSRWLWFALLLFAAFFVSSCAGGGGNPEDDPTVRVANASPDSTSLEFLLNDDVHVGPVPYLGSTPSFVSLEQDVIDIRIREVGATMELWAEVLNFANDNHFLLVAAGLENYGTEVEKRLRLVTVNVNRTAPNGNKARLYVLHGYSRQSGFQTPAIDFQTPGDNPQFEIEEIDFGTTKDVEVDSGALIFEARRTGTQNVLVSAPVTLGAGKIYLVIVSGIEGATGVQAPQISLIELQTEPG
jgi:hypothetical protein